MRGFRGCASLPSQPRWFSPSQLSFYIVTAVLIDTFVIRACLVPSFMAVLGRWNWWPLRFPMVRGNP